MRMVVRFFKDWLERFVAVQGIDRAMAIAAQSYSAFLPLVIVYSATLPRGENEDYIFTAGNARPGEGFNNPGR